MNSGGGDTKAGNEQELIRFMKYGSAVGFGFLAASMEALRPASAGYSFKISVFTGVAFVIGALVALRFWKTVFSARARATKIWMGAMVVIGVGTFLYPIRFVPEDKYQDLFIGLAEAVIALSLVGCLLLMVKRFLDADSRRNGER